MDPNVTLQHLREACTAWHEQDVTAEDGEAMLDIAGNIVELVEALDGWITKGGFLPEPWTKEWDSLKTWLTDMDHG